jgi:hypothetical protein
MALALRSGPVLGSHKLGSFNPSRSLLLPRRAAARPTPLVVRATSTNDDNKKQKEIVDQIEQSLKATGLDAKGAKAVLDSWSTAVGHEVTSEDLRKILVGQSTKAIALVALSTLLDAGAAYSAFVAGGFLGLASEQVRALKDNNFSL